MRNLVAVYTKEMRSYFASPVAYVIAGVFLLLSGFFFYSLLLDFNARCQTYQQYAQYMDANNMPALNVNLYVVTQFFSIMDFIWLLIVPMLTMRLLAEEKKSGTIELLMTSPISTTQIILGKFLASFTLYSAIVALTLVYCGILEMYGEPDWGPIWSGYIGFLLLGGSFIGVGILASAVTENQIVAVLLSFCALLLLWLIDWPANFLGPELGEFLRYLSIIQHLMDFQRGVIDTADVVFYLSFMCLTLFAAGRVIESRRWRR